MFEFIKNKTVFANKYKAHPEAVIISCFFNPQNSSYRLNAFNHFYNSIKHLNHRIIECVIGDSKPQLEENSNIKRVYTKNLLWHKESLLNKIITELPEKYKYVFWVDADVIFTNLNWLVDGVEQLKTRNIIQPFEYCVHLGQDQLRPNFDLDKIKHFRYPNEENNKVWKSFCSVYAKTYNVSIEEHDYNKHGHVGFAWGTKIDILKRVPLYDRALIGGADHIIAHAAAGQIGHICITKSFTDNLDEVNTWSKEFYKEIRGSIGYVPGDLYHIWHGEIEKRQYLKRIKDFTPKTKQIQKKDKNNLYITDDVDDQYMKDYFATREVTNASNGLIMSAFIKEMFSDNSNDINKPILDNFGGGAFGGGGAGSSWDNTVESSQQSDNDTNVTDAAIVSETFS